MSGTVKDFQEMVLLLGGVESPGRFNGNRTDRILFWLKLNKLGARNIQEFPPEDVPNIDDTVILSDGEWRNLETELLALL